MPFRHLSWETFQSEAEFALQNHGLTLVAILGGL